jgi:mannose-6-phosphate isomerase-like protein (cupin superfamily)
MDTFFQNIPAIEGVRKIGRGQGEKFDIAGAHLTWKAKGVDTGYAFSICEQTLGPDEGVPLHSHASVEAFYVLSRAADFFRLVDGKEDWVRCETGDLMILPPNSLHAFYNKTSESCRPLGISTPSHQAFFDAVASADEKRPFASLPFPEAMMRVAQIGAQHNMYFAPVDVSKPVVSANPGLQQKGGNHG